MNNFLHVFCIKHLKVNRQNVVYIVAQNFSYDCTHYILLKPSSYKLYNSSLAVLIHEVDPEKIIKA